MAETYLYTYENHELRKVYIGIGTLDRPYQGHNRDAERLRDHPQTAILRTPEPFSSRQDARKAEAIAIRSAAMFGSAHVLSDHPDQAEIIDAVTNRSGVVTTSHMVPAFKPREGTVMYTDLRRTAIVVVKSEAIDTRPTVHAERGPAIMADRAKKFWKLGKAVNYGLERLLAVLKTHHVILGDWDLDPDQPVVVDQGEFRLLDERRDDPRGVKGMRLETPKGFHWQGQQYSPDVEVA